MNLSVRSSTKIDLSLANGSPALNGDGEPHPDGRRTSERRSERGSAMAHHAQQNQHSTTQTWPFVEIFAHKRYFYLEAQSFTLDGHPEIFLWVWFLGLYLTHLLYNLSYCLSGKLVVSFLDGSSFQNCG